jgi:hypothetical protein
MYATLNSLNNNQNQTSTHTQRTYQQQSLPMYTPQLSTQIQQAYQQQSLPMYTPRVHPYKTPIPVYTPRTTNTHKPKSGPLLWGKPFWFTLHFGALNYPDDPDDEIIKSAIGFILGIPAMLPCDTCKNHAYNYIHARKDILYRIASDKESLFKFYWEFHNDVNKRTGKQTILLSQAYDIFSNNPESAL